MRDEYDYLEADDFDPGGCDRCGELPCECPEPGPCGACGGEIFTALGNLGFMAWFRCRACGMDSGVRFESAPAPASDRVTTDTSSASEETRSERGSHDTVDDSARHGRCKRERS